MYIPVSTQKPYINVSLIISQGFLPWIFAALANGSRYFSYTSPLAWGHIGVGAYGASKGGGNKRSSNTAWGRIQIDVQPQPEMLFCKCLAFITAGHISAENEVHIFQITLHGFSVTRSKECREIRKRGKYPVANKGVQGTLVQLMWCLIVGILN